MKRLVFYICLLQFAIAFPAMAQKEVKILCYNILEGMTKDSTPDKQEFVKWVKNQKPTIFAIQEANKFTKESLAKMAKGWGHPYSVLLKEQGYPVALTSKYPIEDVKIVLENFHHGYIQAKTNGINFIVLHLSPHRWDKRRWEMATILESLKLQGIEQNSVLLGDFNAFSPLDSTSYRDGKDVARFQELLKKYPKNNYLINNKDIDFQTIQYVLDADYVDALKALATASPAQAKTILPSPRRIDFIYISNDMLGRLKGGQFIVDDFTKVYSDHKPLFITLKPKS
ncbi:endonuclease/exonuclease/phosphatase family protein [Sphingobacterium lactis]|uniref:Exodeoxyribonuclease-3 n=1 Tax=Sphingobacterium lactis TaxID=797291 RepID=A0A1H5VDG5_9SPHI|nr:endonuclease/exonuclease/phosphatase family protein [Sphingobacterium lactis]SEF85415.1 exodeoxyribonuclease-3 [Sphingobacterium lactis]